MSAAATAHAGDGARRDGADKLRAKFAAADTNHDGALDRAEAQSGMPRIGKHFDEVDANHDGKLSQAEVADYVLKMRAARQ
jgi:Ca2+-binding EF-hand superfamily protein